MELSIEREYRVRVSRRAKHARLQMSLRDGLVVVVPRGYDRKRIPDLLTQKRGWIEKVAREIEAQRELAPQSAWPERLELRSIGEVWRVEYADAASVKLVECPGNHLKVHDGKGDSDAVHAALRKWLRRKAHRHLKPWLRHLAEENGFEIRRIFIKSQRTRWGSCSEQKNVNLNLKLLFLSEDLVHYVMLHELCHTVYLNHSKKYWALVAQHEPEYASKRKELRKAWKYVPGWVEG